MPYNANNPFICISNKSITIYFYVSDTFHKRDKKQQLTMPAILKWSLMSLLSRSIQRCETEWWPMEISCTILFCPHVINSKSKLPACYKFILPACYKFETKFFIKECFNTLRAGLIQAVRKKEPFVIKHKLIKDTPIKGSVHYSNQLFARDKVSWIFCA